jgi:hypothetical protein
MAPSAGQGQGQATRPADRSHTATIHHLSGCELQQLQQLQRPACYSENPHRHYVCGELQQLQQLQQHRGGCTTTAVA